MILPLALAVLLASVVEATAGFGATIVTVTILAQRMDVHEILAYFLPVNLVMSVYLLARYRDHVAWPVLTGRVLPWMGAGLVVGMAASALATQPLLKVAFATLVVVLALWELYLMRGAAAGPVRPISSAQAGVALLAAGVVHGVFATGGPLAVYVLGRSVVQKGSFRVTLAALWTALNSGLILSYALKGRITADTLQTSALLLVPLVLGGVVGEWLHHRLPMLQFRRGVFVLLLIGGLSLLVRTLLA